MLLALLSLSAAAAVLVAPSSRRQVLAFLSENHLGPQGLLGDWSNIEDATRSPNDLSDIPRLLELLKDEDQTISGEVPPMLAAMGKPAVPALVEALKHDETSVRYGAARALARMKKEEAREAIPALVDAMNDKLNMVRFEAGRALVAIGPESIPSVIQGLKRPERNVRYHSAIVLSLFGPEAKDAVGALTAALSGDKDSFIRAKAADALGNMEAIAKPAMPAILKAQRDDDISVRNRATEAKRKIDPDDCDLGVLAMRSGDWDDAIVFFDQWLLASGLKTAKKLGPDQMKRIREDPQALEQMVECQQGLAEAYQRKNDTAEALEHFDNLIELQPQNPDYRLERARLCRGLHDYAKAVADYKQAIKLLPKAQSAGCCNVVAWILATCPKSDVRDGKEAIRYAAQRLRD